LAQRALALADISRKYSGAAWGRLELAFVSYWELVKLIGTAFLISSAIIAIGFAMWWWLIK
jgi:hypothetical protein